MKLEPKSWCPIIQSDCKKFDCGWFIKVVGTNPQTGEMFDDWNCAISWIPILVIENANEMRKNQQAVESFRNEFAKASDGFVLLSTIQNRVRSVLSNKGDQDAERCLPSSSSHS